MHSAKFGTLFATKTPAGAERKTNHANKPSTHYLQELKTARILYHSTFQPTERIKHTQHIELII